MVVGNASSPKRRRIDDAQAAADTNATLHMFTSNNKRYRWMHSQEPGNDTHGEEGASGILGNSNQREDTSERARDMPHPSDNTARPQHTPTTRPPALNVNTAAGQPSGAHPELVDYARPSTAQVPTPMTAAAALQSRPPSATTPQPSLPSPAPSEDHVNSPGNGSAIVEDSRSTHSPRPVKRGRGRPRKYPIDTNAANTAPVRSRNNSMQANAVPHTPSQLSTTMRNLPPTGNFAPSRSHLRTNSMAHQSNAALTRQHPVQASVPSTPQSDGGLYNMGRMQQRLHEFFAPRAQVLNPIDQGRKTLIQEALEKEDFFYLTLSQVFCLHTCVPQSLPKQLERVQPSSWSFLEQLLCSNSAMSPLAVKWFSEFPAPMHIILASGQSQFFMQQLVIVEAFLQELPRRWDHMMNVSKRRLAPPLTQEMVEELYLLSPVVQTTAFRAIARSFWGDDNSGLRFLEELHKIDQHTYTYQQWKRNAAERTTAWGVYAQVFASWRSQRARHQSSEFEFSPPAAYEYFKQPPPSMLQAATGGGITNGQRQYSRGAVQQLQMMDVNHRLLAQQRAVPGFTVEEQGQLLQSSDRTVLQQGLPPSPLQQLQYQPIQPHAPQPGPQHNQMLVPQNRVPLPQHVAAPQMAPRQHVHVAAPHLKRLLPPENAPPRPLPVQPDTNRVSLHQAHLRSPVPGFLKLLAGQQPLYRHVTGFAMAPMLLDRTTYAQTVSLSMSQADLDSIPSSRPGLLPGEPNVRILEEGSTLYRLRCSKVPPGKGFDTEASWVTAENVWSESLCFQLNGQYLEARRKLHHGRYLPIDLTSLLQAGSNTLNVYTMPSPHDPHKYAVAIERVSVSSHTTLLSAIPSINAADSLASIRASLSSPSDSDDDIIMTSSTLTIPLFDPYRGDRICNIPVRGSSCSHRACFDLETFLSQCQREQPGYPCVPDCWRCPLCRGDVRPQTLVRDEFLMQVRDELARKGLLGTREITVEADGSWRPKAEEKPTGVRSGSLDREEAEAAAKTATNLKMDGNESGKGKGKVIEVIELD